MAWSHIQLFYHATKSSRVSTAFLYSSKGYPSFRVPTHSTLTVLSTIRRHSTNLSNWYNPSLICLLPIGEKVLRGLSKSPFLAINAKGGENNKPKAKGPHHHNFKKNRNEVHIGIYVMAISRIVSNLQLILQLVFLKVNFQIEIYFKNSLES
jgi:hypothetical protein